MSLSHSSNAAVMRNDQSCALPASGMHTTGRSADQRSGTGLDWLGNALYNKLARRQSNPPRWVSLARRLFAFEELDKVLSEVAAGERTDRLSALAEALDIRFTLNGLENLEMVGDRPVILFGNHPTGGGNVLGLSLLLANRFPDHRIIGNRHMKFLSSMSEKMIPVDPFCSTSAVNLEALLKLRREFGTQYQALGVFPAGISSHLKISGTISDRRWSDAFIRIARHHDALLVPIWFSGRNRLRYYISARIRTELGFLALPAEFLRLRGKSITVNIGKPISPDVLRAIPDRHAQMSFLRAGVYELERERAAPRAVATTYRRRCADIGRKIVQPCAPEPIPVGQHLELRFFDGAAARRIEELAVPHNDLDGVSIHVILTPRDRLVPYAHWRVLDWEQFTFGELDSLSPVRRAFQFPGDVARAGRKWLEIASFSIGKGCAGFATMRQIRIGLRRSAAVSHRATDLVGVVKPQETSFVLAGLQFAMLQKASGDGALLRASAAMDLIGATKHHDWCPHRDAVDSDRPRGRDQMELIDPLLRTLARIGVRFGAAGLSADPAPRPCILGRLSLAPLSHPKVYEPRRLPGAALEDADLVREPCPRQLQQGTVEAGWNHPPQGGRGPTLGPTVGFHRL
jgi:putative hemolysin